MEQEILQQILFEIREVKTEVAEVKAEVAGLKAEVADLKAEVAEVKAEVADLKAEVADLKAEVADLKAEVADLKAEVADLKQRVLKLELTVENEVKHNIQIIAEGHITLNKKLDTLKDLDEKITVMSDDLSILKSITKDNLYDLRALKVAR